MSAFSTLDKTLQTLTPRPMKYLNDYLKNMVRGKLWLKVIIGMILGLIVGALLGPSTGLVATDNAATISNWLALPGQLFLALIQMIVIPLVFASIILGLAATENIEQLRRMGIRVVLYFIATTALAIIIGIWLAITIQPGNYVDANLVQAALGTPSVLPTGEKPSLPGLGQLPQAVISILPSNPLSSMVESQMLQIVIFGMVFGVSLVMMPPAQAKPLLELFSSLQEVCMTVVRWAMHLAPFAVFGLMTQLTAKIGFEALLGMAIYVFTVLAGLATMLVLYMVVLFTISRERPFHFIHSIKDVMLLAFSTSSSAAVMPLSIKAAEERLGIRRSVSQFVIPLGATINMNGTALYQGVATIFLAQVFGVDIGIGGLVLIVVTAVGASIGAPATPGVGIVILAMILGTVGIPPSGIALIMGVDRILDMSRTAINVCGDLVAAKLMDHWSPETSEISSLKETEPATIK